MDYPTSRRLICLEKPKSNFFVLPNEIIGHFYEMVRNGEHAAPLVYLYIVRHCWGYHNKPRALSYKHFTEGYGGDSGVGFGRTTIKKALAYLEQEGYIIVERRRGRSNVYRLPTPDDENKQESTRSVSDPPNAQTRSVSDHAIYKRQKNKNIDASGEASSGAASNEEVVTTSIAEKSKPEKSQPEAIVAFSDGVGLPYHIGGAIVRVLDGISKHYSKYNIRPSELPDGAQPVTEAIALTFLNWVSKRYSGSYKHNQSVAYWRARYIEYWQAKQAEQTQELKERAKAAMSVLAGIDDIGEFIDE